MTTSNEVKNFGFSCQQKWEDMTITEDKRIRFCEECGRNVYHCANETQLDEAIANTQCVKVIFYDDGWKREKEFIGFALNPSAILFMMPGCTDPQWRL